MDEAAFLFFRILKILFRKHGGNENFDDNFFKTEIFLNEVAFFVSIYFLLFLTVFNKKTLSLFYN